MPLIFDHGLYKGLLIKFFFYNFSGEKWEEVVKLFFPIWIFFRKIPVQIQHCRNCLLPLKTGTNDFEGCPMIENLKSCQYLLLYYSYLMKTISLMLLKRHLKNNMKFS